MGYYTEFEIEFTCMDAIDIWEAYVETHGLYMEDLTGEPEEPTRIYNAKWYEFEDDMIGFSKLLPNELLIVKGTGEEAGDVWKQCFRGGKASPKAEFNWDMLPDPEVPA